MRITPAIILFAISLAACQSASPGGESSIASAAHPQLHSAQVGADLAEALCSGCHAIKPGEISPNPQAPTFAMIANTDGLDIDTLGTWMHDSHNFPEKMNFEVADEDVDDLAAYIITLRSEDYQPPIQ